MTGLSGLSDVDHSRETLLLQSLWALELWYVRPLSLTHWNLHPLFAILCTSMKSRYVLAVLLSSAIAAVLSPFSSASAQNATVNFNGNVVKACWFGNPTVGTLSAVDSNTNGLADSFATATPATVTLACNTNYSFRVFAPQVVAPPTGFDLSKYSCTSLASIAPTTGGAFPVQKVSNPCTSPINSSVRVIGTAGRVNAANVNVTMKLDKLPTSSDLPAGNYTFTVRLDATPN